MLTKKINWGKTIFLGMGPAVYLGFWMPVIVFANPFSLKILTFVALACLGLSIIYFLISYLCLSALQKWLIPALKKHETYEFHKKYAWMYALFLSIPATYMGFFAVAMTYGCPGGHPEFNIVQAIWLVVYGWGIGAFYGAVAGVIILPFLDLLLSLTQSGLTLQLEQKKSE